MTTARCADLAFEDLPGDGLPLLFVHGFLLTRALWTPVAHALGDTHRRILVDLRGHGDSPLGPAGFSPRDATRDLGAEPAPPDAVIADYADDLAALLDRLDERRRVVLVGLSMGGIVGFEFFRRHRARLAALVLIGSRANAESPAGIGRWGALIRAVARVGPRAAADAFMDMLFARVAAPALRDAWRAIIAAQPRDGVILGARALAARADGFALLPTIDLPTQVAVGRDDVVTPPDTMREIANRIPGARYAELPDAGHLLPVEQPRALANILAAFLTDCVAPRR
ncbi:MAG: alpha/beta fold hydrolase [Phycisphaerae bacterium]